MSRIVDGFPQQGKLAAVEPLLVDLLDGAVHEFVRGEDWPLDESARQIQPRLGSLGRKHGFKVKTSVRKAKLYAQIIGEVESDG